MNEIIDGLVERLGAVFDLEKLGAQLAELLVDVLIAAIVLTVFYGIWLILRRTVVPRINRRLDKTNAAFADTILKFSVLSIGVLAALAAAGVQTTAVLASLGVVGLTIGFALRDTLSNIIAGILIFLDRPFTIDDLVEIEGKYGRVDKITLRTTRIITNDGRMLAVPNSEVMNETVISYTNFPHLRLDIDVTIGVEEDIDKARKIMLDLVKGNSDFLQDPVPRVVVTALNDYNVALALQAWLDNEREHVAKRFELRERVFKSLTAAGIDMPFETLEITGVPA